MNIRYLGHATVEFTINGSTIMVDPFIKDNPLAAHISVESLQVDYALLTHAHGDHIGDVETIHANKPLTIISNYEIYDYFQKKGINGHPMNIGGNWKFPFGEVKMVQALHSSSFPDGTYGGNPCGYVLSTEGRNIYIAGDTALFSDMQLLKKLYEKIDLAILPIGDNFTMGIHDAIIASDFVGCDHILGVHYDTFDWIKIDKEKAISAFNNAGKRLSLLPIGDSLEL